MDYGLAEQFKIQLKDDVLEVQVPDLCKTDEKWFVSKFRVVADLRELTDVHVMRFLEEYEKKVEAPKAGAAAEAKPEEAKTEAKPKAAPKKARQPKKPAERAKSEEELPPEEKAAGDVCGPGGRRAWGWYGRDVAASGARTWVPYPTLRMCAYGLVFYCWGVCTTALASGIGV